MRNTSNSEPGQAVYSPFVLKIYDWWVLSVSNDWIWKCPTSKILAWFNDHVTANHLDVGVGTGYFPDHATFPGDNIRLGLMDLNQNCLNYAASRLQRFQPVQYKCDILQPIDLDLAPFDSISLNYVLHCLPGKISQKGSCLDHLSALLNDGGCLFGATILGPDAKTSWSARFLMQRYNQRGIFGNELDTLTDLETALADRFSQVRIKQHGSVALFARIK